MWIFRQEGRVRNRWHLIKDEDIPSLQKPLPVMCGRQLPELRTYGMRLEKEDYEKGKPPTWWGESLVCKDCLRINGSEK
jgi:hypothetical protein